MRQFKYLTTSMLCDYIHQSRSTIYKKVKHKTIPHRKLNRTVLFDREEIDQWVNNGGKMVQSLPDLPKL